LAWGIFVDQEVLKLHPFFFTKRVGFYKQEFLSAIDIKKYLKKAKEELWKLNYFTMQKYNLQNIL
jgi:hypothetical protein